MADITAGSVGRDVRVIGLVGVAHFFSHFFQLVLPPLFPLLKPAWDVSYTELGLMMTVFYAASGLCQTPAGFLVDRFGAHRVLTGGLALLAGAIALVGLAPGFWMVLPIVALAGMGNSVFHPADYAILTHRVSPLRIARAYSVHTLGGTLGWAAAPAAMLGLSAVMPWQAALGLAAAAGLTVAALLTAGHASLDIGANPGRKRDAGTAPARVLTAAPVLMCFAYFVLLSVSLTGLQTFLPTTLTKLWGTPLAVASLALTAYLVGSGAGTVAGGWLADRTPNHDQIVAAGLAGAAALIFLIGRIALPETLLIAAVAVAGFLSGTTTPSRDMLVRAATPPGSAGKVFGFVYSGLDLGSSTGPLVLGMMLDHGHPGWVPTTIALSLAATILSAVALKRGSPAATVAAE